jgi:uncharacterized membrane protein
MSDNDVSNALPPRDLSSEKNTAIFLYVMHGLAPFTFWSLGVVAMIVGLVKRNDVTGTWIDSHYGWLSRTFWFGLLWAAIAWGLFWILGLATLGFGMIFLWVLPVAVIIWYLYRVVIGIMRLGENRPIGM